MPTSHSDPWVKVQFWGEGMWHGTGETWVQELGPGPEQYGSICRVICQPDEELGKEPGSLVERQHRMIPVGPPM